MNIQYSTKSLPVLCDCDVLIAGGSLAGIAAALVLARAGRRVMLVEPRTYLGREITATLRPWLTVPDHGPLPALIQEIIRAAGQPVENEPEIPLKLDALKIRLEDLLLEAGVGLLYGSYPVQVVAEDSAVVIGNKSGRQVLRCGSMIDASETALLARLAGADFEPAGPLAPNLHRTLEYITRASRTKVIAVPDHFGLVGSQLLIHAGTHSERHKYVEIALSFPPKAHGYETLLERELEARRRSLDLALYLNQEVPEFFDSYLASAAYELHGPKTERMTSAVPAWAADYSGHLPALDDPAHADRGLDFTAFAGPIEGLWCLNDSARLAREEVDGFQNPIAAAGLGERLGEWLAGQRLPKQRRVEPAAAAATPAPASSPEGWVVRELESPQAGRIYARQSVGSSSIAFQASGDVLVAGGGTAGAVAAIASGREGVETLLLEMNPGLGGTGTLGGVPEYWMGRQAGFMLEIQQSVQALDQQLGFVAPDRWHQWSLEGKMTALLRLVQSAGARVHFYVICIATIVDGQQVRGVVAATPYGPLAFGGKVVIDATGDGDIAAFAGAEFMYGAGRDATVMWTSMPQIGAPGLAMGGNFTSMADVSNVEDTTRMILAGRRRRSGIHDHGIYLAPRESRHILADEVISFTDMLLRRCWPDVINIFYSNYDIKGKSSSDWNLSGLISANLEVELPYRVLLPRGLEGLLVSGKAFSAGSDAIPLIRMQADIENLGCVTGVAAALAATNGCQPRDLPVAHLQERLVALGILPAAVLTRTLRPRRLSTAEMQDWIERLDSGQPLYAINNRPEQERYTERIPFVEVCTAGPQVLALLGQALENVEGDNQIRIAQALAMCGDASGAPLLAEKIQAMLGDTGLPARTAFILNTVQHMPDHAAMPDVVYLIYNLGMARDRSALPVWANVAERLNFTDEDFRDPYLGPFYYVDAVCYGAERLADPAAVPILKRMHAHPLLHDQVCRQGVQPDYMLERLAVLELLIGRALARCASPDGYTILIAYLNDVRALLAEHAHRELVRISGQDFGKDAHAWQTWLAKQQGRLFPKPWTGPSDAVRSWGAEILVEAGGP